MQIYQSIDALFCAVVLCARLTRRLKSDDIIMAARIFKTGVSVFRARLVAIHFAINKLNYMHNHACLAINGLPLGIEEQTDSLSDSLSHAVTQLPEELRLKLTPALLGAQRKQHKLAQRSDTTLAVHLIPQVVSAS